MAHSRFRSVRYDLDAGVELARIVANADDGLTADLLAPALGYRSTNNGSFLSRLASARLFGLVAGRGTRVELTERGRAVLAGGDAAAAARRDAFLAVPLFRAVHDALGGTPIPPAPDLAVLLSAQFGESPAKAPAVAAKLLDSAGQAGLTRIDAGITSFTPVENRASLSLLPGVGWQENAQGGRSSRRAEGADMAGRDIAGRDMAGRHGDEQGLWLDEEPTHHRTSAWRRAGVIAAVAACVAVVAVPVALVATGRPAHQTSAGQPTTLGKGAAEHQVLSALSATTDAGSFNFSYAMSATPPTSAPPPTTTPQANCTVMRQGVPPAVSVPAAGVSPVGAPGLVPSATASSGTVSGASTSGASTSSTSTSSASTSSTSTSSTTSSASALSGSSAASGSRSSVGIAATGPPGVVEHVSPVLGGVPPKVVTQRVCIMTARPDDTVGEAVAGNGTIDTSPMAMVASAKIGGLLVTVRVDDTTVYEDLGGLDPSLAPSGSQANATGQLIPEFAGITEGTLGAREGAMAMIGMANPTGYLDLSQASITGADQTGTGTVDGVPVTDYQVSIDPAQLVNAPGVSAQESQTISDAIGVLKGAGYTGTMVDLSVDGSGYIRESKTVASFSDGATAILDATFSNFGCAGTVLMPGQQGSGQPPTGCTSPDTGKALATPSTPTPSTLAPSNTATTVPPATTTTTVTPTTTPATVPSTTVTTQPISVPPNVPVTTVPGRTTPTTTPNGSTTSTTVTTKTGTVKTGTVPPSSGAPPSAAG